MGASQETTPQPSEKDLLHAHYNQQQHGRDGEFPPTPTSVSLGSPISPLIEDAAASNAGLASSSHTYSDDDHLSSALHLPQTPPPYSGPVGVKRTPASQPTLFSASSPPQRYPGLPQLNYQLYSPPLFELSSDCTTIKSTVPYLSSNASALISLVRAQATIPPKPQVLITGRRGSPHSKPDFAIKLNLMSLLIPEDPAKRMDYIRCVGAGEAALRGGLKPALMPDLNSLEAWARRFVEDGAQVKEFVLERTVVNLDTAWLEGQIRSLVAAMGYQGVLSVTFPVTHARVVVQNPDKVNKFFTGLTALFAGRRTYEVVRAVWPFASCARDARGAERVCVVQSEEKWWSEWKDPIRFATTAKRHGWVTNEDKLEVLMEGKGKGIGKLDWGDE